MGWTSFPMQRKPSSEKLEQMADEDFTGPNTAILDKSSWTSWNTQRFTLFQITRPEKQKPITLIAVTIAEYRDHQLFTKTMDETEGPLAYNCPMRLLTIAEQNPPLNEFSANWRDKVHKYHNRNKQIDALLKQLKGEYPTGNIQLVVDGTNVLYYPARRKGRTIHAYQNPRTNTLHRINRDAIDIEETLKLRGATPLSPNATSN